MIHPLALVEGRCRACSPSLLTLMTWKVILVWASLASQRLVIEIVLSFLGNAGGTAAAWKALL